MGEEKSNHLIILILFIALFLINSTSALLVRYSQGVLKEQYIKTSAVFVTEFMKLLLAISLITFSRIKSGKGGLIGHFFMLIKECYWLFPSAFIYLILNFLYYYCLSHVEAVVFTVLYQLKIFASALMTILLLRRRISIQRWIAVIMLFIGVVVIKIDDISRSETTKEEVESSWIGFFGTIVMAICSGLGGVYFELVLKQKRTEDIGLWERNFQLYFPSCILTLGSVFVSDFSQVVNKGLFSGMSLVTFSCSFSWAVAGLVTSLVLKYGSSVLNGFGSAFAVIATGLGSMFFHGFHFTIPFVLGSAVVSFSVVLYQVPIEQMKESILRLMGKTPDEVEDALLDKNPYEMNEEDDVEEVEMEDLSDSEDDIKV